MRFYWISFLLVLLVWGCKNTPETTTLPDNFVIIRDGQFILNGKPWYFIGTNFWYGPILGSQGEFGDRKRLIRELDFMKSKGINNLRVLVGVDGPEGTLSKVMPSLQSSPGVYKESLFDGLDFFMNEISRREMYAVIYLNNTWEWSGGYAQYLNWTGKGPIPIPSVTGWEIFEEYVSDFFSCDSCTRLFKKHIAHILSRTNFYSGIKYTEDPSILSWQIANEPRPMGEKNKTAYENWLKDIASYIKELDGIHLVSTGSEGWEGSERDIDLYTRIHSDPNIDYLTMHIWPKNWKWIQPENMESTWDNTLKETDAYIEKHVEIAQRLKKPITLEEFGFPRDKEGFTINESTFFRDQYYGYIFDKLVQSAEAGDVFAGCNFWAWGGYARPADGHLYWQIGDDYMGDPAQEEQGLNSVFDVDTTMIIIEEYNGKLSDIRK